MKKLPKVYQNESLNNIKNNKKVFDSLKDKNIVNNNDNNKLTKKNDNSILTVKDKIKNLINDNNYIFNKEVTLIFNDYDKTCHIAGVVNNHIITMDNEIIKISDLKDIKY